LQDAVKYRILDANPANRVKRPKREHHEARWWSADEAATFLSCPRVRAHRMFAFMRLGLDSGMRIGELAGLRWPDIDFETRTVHVRRSLEEVDGVFKEKDPKSKAGRRKIPVSKETIEALADHRKRMLVEGLDVKEGTVFLSRKGTWVRNSNIRRFFHLLSDHAGVVKIRPYDMRHSAASMWLAAGVSIVAVAARLGHEKPEMTLRHYAHALPSEQGVIADVASRLLATKVQAS
jgi:integrase